MIKYLFCLQLIVTAAVSAQPKDPAAIGASVINRVMQDCSFELSYTEQKPSLDIQVLDFSEEYCGTGIAYALSYLSSPSDTTLLFGVSHHSPLSISVNSAVVYRTENEKTFYFREPAYGVFEFNDSLRISVKKGYNTIVVKTRVTDNNSRVYLREITPAETDALTSFSLLPANDSTKSSPWLFLGLLPGNSLDQPLEPDSVYAPTYSFHSTDYAWKHAATKYLMTALPSRHAVYQREPYSEWNYPNGILMFSILQFGKEQRKPAYVDFVKQYCDFTVKNLSLFRTQVQDRHAFRGFDYRIFRKSMLDDAGSPPLPFVQLLLDSKTADYKPLVDSMALYVLHGQTTLDDGTLCRIEPEAYTIWADDLFMSVPLLLRYASLTRDGGIYDMIAKQIINFQKYLYNPKTGLYTHGYFVRTGKPSEVFWSRANGWVVWAMSEALLYLPERHKDYQRIKKIFQQHIAGLASCQGESGMWHQVLNDPSTYEESSSTAMFTIALARGVRNRWIDQKYKTNLDRAWRALQKNISDDGVVKNICRGTGLGRTNGYYAEREKFLNDPRGLGAIITACGEMSRQK